MYFNNLLKYRRVIFPPDACVVDGEKISTKGYTSKYIYFVFVQVVRMSKTRTHVSPFHMLAPPPKAKLTTAIAPPACLIGKLDDMLNDWDEQPLGRPLGEELRVGQGSSSPPKTASTSSSNSENTGRAAPPPPPPPAASSINPSVDPSAGGPGPSSAGGRAGAVDSEPVGTGAASSAATGTASSGGGGGGSATVRGGIGAQASGLAASSPSAPADGRDRGEVNKTSSSNGSSRALSDWGSSVSSGPSRKRSCTGSGSGNGEAAAGGGGYDHSVAPSRNPPHNNNSKSSSNINRNTYSPHNGASSAYLGASCFPLPLPRPAGACSVVQEARAFAPAQHLAVLQALLNGEEEQGDKDFHSDSDSEREESSAGGGGGDSFAVAGSGTERVAGGSGMRAT